MARHDSIQRETYAPESSCGRNRAGTAIRPLSSTVCRYSPVNTCRASPVVWVAWSWPGRRWWFGGWPRVCVAPHFPPLHATSGHSSARTRHVNLDFGAGPRGVAARRRAVGSRAVGWAARARVGAGVAWRAPRRAPRSARQRVGGGRISFLPARRLCVLVHGLSALTVLEPARRSTSRCCRGCRRSGPCRSSSSACPGTA